MLAPEARARLEEATRHVERLESTGVMVKTADLRAALEHIKELEDGLRPVAKFWTEATRNGHSRDDVDLAWGFNAADLTWGDIRRAHALIGSEG